MNPGLNRDQLTELKELLAERIVDNMSTKDLVEYVMDDYFTSVSYTHLTLPTTR